MSYADTQRLLLTLLSDAQRDLDGRWRPLVAWGFDIGDVNTTATPNPFAPATAGLDEYATTVQLRARVIWKLAPGWPTRAGDEADHDNIDELREIIAFLLRSGEYPALRRAELVEWSAELPKEAREDPDANWSIQALVRSM